MKTATAAAAVEAQLKAREEAINRRVEAIGGELSTVRESIKTSLLNNPAVRASGAVALGLLVGWILGGIGRSRGKEVTAALTPTIAAALAQLKETDREAADQLKRALDERPSTIVVSQPEISTRGPIRSLVGTTLRIGMGVLLREGVQRLTAAE